MGIKYASRDVQNMITKLSTYETLLSDLLPSLDLEKQQTVRNTLGDLVRGSPVQTPLPILLLVLDKTICVRSTARPKDDR